MKILIKGLLFLTCCIIFSAELAAQPPTYILNGSATQNSCNCYTLTTASANRSGSVWNVNKINLNNSFDFIFNVYLGCSDLNGADGIVFMLQPISTSVGTTGGGLGFEGVSPSVGVTLDTWQNLNNNDPDFDHIAIQTNGILTHGSDLAGPVSASATSPNIEDCQWHTLRVTWNAGTKTLQSFFDGVLRVQAQNDLVASVFSNNPDVFWGFSAATGGSYNLQQFCTALNPSFTTNFTSNVTCAGNPVSFMNASESFTAISSYFWDFGDNSTSQAANPPPHNYAAPGLYNVKLAIKGFDGCESDTLRRTITIGDYPVAGFTITDTCQGLQPLIKGSSTASVGTISQWNWKVDGIPSPPGQAMPDLTSLDPGTHTIALDVVTSNGCASANSFSQPFEVLPAPSVAGFADDGCVGRDIRFTGTQLDQATTINSWNWIFTSGSGSAMQNPTRQFTQPGNYNVRLNATATNGCISEFSELPLFINEATAFAGNDTVLIQNEPFRLNGTGGSTYNWSPATGMTNAASANPVIMPVDDITYTLEVTTEEGCTDTDQISITVFKGSQIYVPSGFSPNNDGTNDRLGPYYIGIREIGSFAIYNRWGQLLFLTRDRNAQWDGTYKGIRQPAGSYVWRLSAVDYIGKKFELKGTTTLIN